jgi:hypothetical protein
VQAHVFVRINKKGQRNQLLCTRDDGSSVVADLGPNLPQHDLAHYVVERRFGLRDGFFGNICRGYSPVQLSDKAVIKSLGVEAYRAEILARALASLLSGACAPVQFEELVNVELSGMSLSRMSISPDVRDAMVIELQDLLGRYRDLREGESLMLEFKVGMDVQAAR